MSSEGRTNGLSEKRGHLMQTRHGRICAVLITNGGKVNRTGVLLISIADGASQCIYSQLFTAPGLAEMHFEHLAFLLKYCRIRNISTGHNGTCHCEQVRELCFLVGTILFQVVVGIQPSIGRVEVHGVPQVVAALVH